MQFYLPLCLVLLTVERSLAVQMKAPGILAENNPSLLERDVENFGLIHIEFHTESLDLCNCVVIIL